MSIPLSYIEISKVALRANVASFREKLGANQQLIAVVKGNAYGHGLREVVSSVEDLVDGYQVDDIEELQAVRALSQKRVLVLGYVQQCDLDEAIALGGELAFYDLERLPSVAAAGTNATIHLKIDALLGRQGLLPEQVPDFVTALKQFPSITLGGVSSHYSNLEDTPLRSHAEAQQARFERALGVLLALGYPNVPTHFSSSAGILAFEGDSSSHALVRLGIGLYGLYPSPSFARMITLHPCLRWVSHLAQVKDLPAGFPVGYGLTHITEAPMTIGIVPQGYSDGYDRLLSSKGEVLIGGYRRKVIGRVAMNMFAVDLTGLAAKPGDEVVLLGSQGGETISAEELGEACGTINYEIVARLSALLPRLMT